MQRIYGIQGIQKIEESYKLFKKVVSFRDHLEKTNSYYFKTCYNCLI
jgi:hypothetical protein